MLVLTQLAAAQQSPSTPPWIDVLERRLAETPAGSVGWYRLSLARIAAIADRDLADATRAAERLWQQAGKGGPVGVREAAAAWAALTSTIVEGPVAASRWRERASEPPPEADPWLQADYYLTRSRTCGALWEEGEALRHAVRGQEFAERSDDWLIRGRAALLTLHTTPSRRIEDVRALFARARAAGADAEVDALAPLLLLAEADYHELQGDYAGARRLLAEAAPLAAAQGNMRVSARIAASLAAFAIHDPDAAEGEQARELMAAAQQRFEDYGNRLGVLFAIDQQAELAIVGDDLEGARALIEQQVQLLEGRGWRMAERDALITQFNLAIKEHDGPRADDLSRQLDEFLPEEARIESGLLSVQERVAKAERARGDMQRKLERQQLALAEQANSVWMWGAIAGVFGLGAVLAVSWLGRRRLLRANLQLGEKIVQLEETRSAKGKLEERMRQMERTEGLGTLAAGVAHDFNNLLTSMIGGAEMLRARHVDVESQELAEMILSAGQQGSRLCRQLQSYSGGVALERAPLDVKAVIEEMLPTLAASTRGRVAVRVAPRAPSLVVQLDRAQFEQILLNLVQNSAEAGARNVTVAIEDAEAASCPSETLSGRVARLRVVDDGRGMTKEVVTRIFDPFFTTKFPGRGLGLAVVFGGIKRHGGSVQVVSSVDGGTRFTIELPLVEGDVVAAVAGEASTPRGDQPIAKTVIVVDDEAIVRKAMASMLASLDCAAHAFEGGDAALAFVASMADRRGVVAIVDLTMPGMDGEEVVRRLRELDGSLPIVLMSGHDDEYVEEQARTLSVDHVLIKPFLVGEVRDVLQRVADRVQLPR
ncbi:MAG: ATP-binding protein [Planctomycetota bacterium]